MGRASLLSVLASTFILDAIACASRADRRMARVITEATRR